MVQLGSCDWEDRRSDCCNSNMHIYKLTSMDINGGDRLSVLTIKILMIVEACVSLLLLSLYFSFIPLSSLLFSSFLYMPQMSEGQHWEEISENRRE